jgi:hypothetical protein
MQSSSHSSLPFSHYLKKLSNNVNSTNPNLLQQQRRDKSFQDLSPQLPLDPEQFFQSQIAAVMRLKRSGAKLKAAAAFKPKPIER